MALYDDSTVTDGKPAKFLAEKMGMLDRPPAAPAVWIRSALTGPTT